MTIEDRLRTLIRMHHANFALQLVAVDQLLSCLDQDGCLDSRHIAEAQHLTHQMKGAAGSMGFADVGAVVSELDESLTALKAIEGPLSAAQIRRSRELLAQLQCIAAETTPEMSSLYNANLSKLAQ